MRKTNKTKTTTITTQEHMHTCMQAHAQTHKHTHVLVHAHTDFEDMASLIPTNVFTLEINRTKPQMKRNLILLIVEAILARFLELVNNLGTIHAFSLVMASSNLTS